MWKLELCLRSCTVGIWPILSSLYSPSALQCPLSFVCVSSPLMSAIFILLYVSKIQYNINEWIVGSCCCPKYKIIWGLIIPHSIFFILSSTSVLSNIPCAGTLPYQQKYIMCFVNIGDTGETIMWLKTSSTDIKLGFQIKCSVLTYIFSFFSNTRMLANNISLYRMTLGIHHCSDVIGYISAVVAVVVAYVPSSHPQLIATLVGMRDNWRMVLPTPSP